MRAAVEEFGRVDVVCNVAGIADAAMLADVTTEHYDRLMEVDLRGVFLGMKHGVRAMLESGNGGVDRQLVVDRRHERLALHERVLGREGGRHLVHQVRRDRVRRTRASASTASARASSTPR